MQGDNNDENIKRGIINIFLRAVYLYDDRFTLLLNGSDTPITIDDILLDEIEEGLEGDLTNCEGCSSLVADAPPLCKSLGPYRAPGFFCPKFVPVSSRSKQNNETHRLGVVAKG